MKRADWVALAAVGILAVSMLATPSEGIGIDGRLVLAAALLAFLARPTLTTKEPS